MQHEERSCAFYSPSAVCVIFRIVLKIDYMHENVLRRTGFTGNKVGVAFLLSDRPDRFAKFAFEIILGLVVHHGRREDGQDASEA